MPPAEACRFAEPNYWLLPEYYEHLLSAEAYLGAAGSLAKLE